MDFSNLIFQKSSTNQQGASAIRQTTSKVAFQLVQICFVIIFYSPLFLEACKVLLKSNLNTRTRNEKNSTITPDLFQHFFNEHFKVKYLLLAKNTFAIGWKKCASTQYLPNFVKIIGFLQNIQQQSATFTIKNTLRKSTLPSHNFFFSLANFVPQLTFG